jgi:formylmethanofuran dehydrogenase subunit E
MKLSNEEALKIASQLHGHLAPGLALGVRMSSLAMEKLKLNRGNKKAIAVSETARCLADGIQATTGCTLGHGNIIVKNYGKLALTIGRIDTGRGIRIGLREEAYRFSPLMKKWMMREGKLTKDEEEELSKSLLELDEKYLEFQYVEISLDQNFENSAIVKCTRCGDLVPEALIVRENGLRLCRSCANEKYYRPVFATVEAQ